MCDTVVVVRPNEVWFAKNSDRDPNEAQRLDSVPAAEHATGARLRCTWITIPQARRTHRVLLSRPFWMWGAEMGANSQGVVIGNEAVFARQRPAETGLTGMDLVRLGLERGATAAEAVAVITELLALHGQGGRAGYSHPGFSYHNSFLVADSTEAWVVETLGREAQRERVLNGVRAISNGYTLPKFAARADRLRSTVAACEPRRCRVAELAAEASEVADLATVLRDHGAGHAEPHYQPLRGAMTGPCMHFGGLVAGSQSVASWVGRLAPGEQQHWVTGTSAPCMSLFRPVDLDDPPDFGAPDGVPDADSLWWRFEELHRRWLVDSEGVALARAERDKLERAAFASPQEWRAHHQRADEWLSQHRQVLDRPAAPDQRPWWLRRVWAGVAAESYGNRLPPRPVTHG